MEKNWKKKDLNHFAVHLKLTQYCKSTILQLKKKEFAFRIKLTGIKEIIIHLFPMKEKGQNERR